MRLYGKIILWILIGLSALFLISEFAFKTLVTVDKTSLRGSQQIAFIMIHRAFCYNEKMCWQIPKELSDLPKINCDSCEDKRACKIDLGYLQKGMDRDVWGNSISLSNSSEGVRFLSFGADEKPGGDGQNADIEYTLRCDLEPFPAN